MAHLTAAEGLSALPVFKSLLPLLLLLPLGCRESSHPSLDAGTNTGTNSGTGTGTGQSGVFKPVVADALAADPQTVERGYSGFLRPTDVTPSGREGPLGRDELPPLIDGYRDIFFLKNPKRAFNRQDCNDAAFDAASFQATRNAAVFQIDTPDFSACLNSVPPANPQTRVTYTKAKIRYFDKTTCDGADLSVLNGKSPGQITDADLMVCDNAASANQLRNAVLEYEFTATNGTTSLGVRAVSVVSVMTADGRACHGARQSGLWVYEPCVFVSRTVYDFTGEQGDASALKALYKSLYLKAEGEALNGDPPGPFYTSGRFRVMLNGWSGVLTYTNSAQPPAWSLSQGPEMANGVFTGEARP